jgi:ribosomal protein S6
MEELLNNICQDNNYILEFQATDKTKQLAQEIIKLRKGIIYSINEVYNCIIDLINELNSEIKITKDAIYRSYLRDILYGLEKSRDRIDNYSNKN